MLTVGSLFSGIGGLELGLERVGMRTVWQVEKEPYARRVLERHWPHVARFDDVRSVGAENLARVDLVCGGFPCQDLSDLGTAWERPGLDGERSGLWWQFDRIVGELAPRFVVAENVDGGAWRRWVPGVRRALHLRGYASVPLRLRASDVGAPFAGPRVFVVAAADHEGESARALYAEVAELSAASRALRQDWGCPSPRAVGVADGVPNVVDRNRCTGNAVVPACAEVVGRFVVRLAARLAQGAA